MYVCVWWETADHRPWVENEELPESNLDTQDVTCHLHNGRGVRWENPVIDTDTHTHTEEEKTSPPSNWITADLVLANSQFMWILQGTKPYHLLPGRWGWQTCWELPCTPLQLSFCSCRLQVEGGVVPWGSVNATVLVCNLLPGIWTPRPAWSIIRVLCVSAGSVHFCNEWNCCGISSWAKVRVKFLLGFLQHTLPAVGYSRFNKLNMLSFWSKTIKKVDD